MAEILLNALSKFIHSSDKKSFRVIYEELFPHVYNFCFYKTRNAELSQDITQDAFKKLWEKRSNLTENGSLKSLLLKMSHNMIIDHFRKKMNQEIPQDDFSRSEHLSEPVNEQVQEVYRILETVEEKHKDVFLMHRVEGFSYKELAETYSVSVKTIESWMSKVLKRLRSEMSENE